MDKINFEDFDIEKVKKKETRSIILSIRINKTESKWLKEHKVSPSKLFLYALHKVMEK